VGGGLIPIGTQYNNAHETDMPHKSNIAQNKFKIQPNPAVTQGMGPKLPRETTQLQLRPGSHLIIGTL
jgi:hypothetical protein